MLRARYDFEVWAPSLLFWETRKQVTEAGGACLSEQLWASPVGIFHSAHGVCPDKSPMATCPCDGQLSQPFCPIFWWNLVCRHVCSCQGVPGGGQRPRLRGVSETQTGMWRNLCGCSVSWGAVQCGLWSFVHLLSLSGLQLDLNLGWAAPLPPGLELRAFCARWILWNQ